MQTGFRLTRSRENHDQIAALTDHVVRAGGRRIGIDGLAQALSRKARRRHLLPRLLGRRVHRALTWDVQDRHDPDWYPQGISNSARTGVDADLLSVAWYSKGDQGVRVSFLDLARRRYDHVLLVEPVLEDGEASLRPLQVHAGGLVWHNRFLHVAATRRGFLTCDLDDLMWVPDAVPLDTHGHRYVLPVRWSHRAQAQEDLEKLRYSFMSLDRSDGAPYLVVGEYGSPRQTRRLARIAVDDETGAVGTDGVARPVLLAEDNPPRMQGAAVVDGTWYVSASQGHWKPGTIHVGRPGDFRGIPCALPMGPEDLVHDPQRDVLWSATEHPGRRWIVAMRRADLYRGRRAN